MELGVYLALFAHMPGDRLLVVIRVSVACPSLYVQPSS